MLWGFKNCYLINIVIIFLGEQSPVQIPELSLVNNKYAHPDFELNEIKEMDLIYALNRQFSLLLLV